ncbi:MAG: hydrogenase maturation protease [Armatimonadetes bacterium]|nr:hydrogenase maturation protease [Armatimonadota bacterium]
MTPRILIAGIGNIFLGDDGFGVEVARRLAGRALPEGVTVADFGIRGMDLAYALLDDYDALILIDAAPRGEPPGTLSLIEHSWDGGGAAAIDTHSMDPVKVLRLARELGARPTRTFVVACEPAFLGGGGGFEDVVVALSEPVRGAVAEAISMVESLLDKLVHAGNEGGERICEVLERPS